MFSKKEKIEVICEYIKGLGTSVIMKKHGIKGSATIYEWYRIYKQFGPAGFDMYKHKTIWTYSFKMKVIKWRIDHNASFPVTAKKFKIRSPSIIWQWEHQMMTGQLKPEKKGKQSMTKNSSDKNDKNLEEENRYLRARVAYLEKLQALVQKKKQSQTKKKHKQ